MNRTRSQQVKRLTRRYMLARRCAQSATSRARGSRLVRRRIAALPEFRLAQTVALYLAMPDEVDVDTLVELARASGKRTAVPVWRADRRVYGFREMTTVRGLRPGHYGLREPVEGAWLPAAAFDLILVPGVAFDHRGRRIGMGAGWYDRLLAEVHGAVCAGVAFDFQVLPALPRNAHDVSMHLVVAESATWRCQWGQGRRLWESMYDANAKIRKQRGT